MHALVTLLQLNTGDETLEGICVPHCLTYEDIADLIGSGRQMVTTLINELAGEKVLTCNRRHICFPDVKELQKLVNVV